MWSGSKYNVTSPWLSVLHPSVNQLTVLVGLSSAMQLDIQCIGDCIFIPADRRVFRVHSVKFTLLLDKNECVSSDYLSLDDLSGARNVCLAFGT